ncbi:MAG TPA: xanthine dehydrogenase family protein molybdopterin-binding subunit, partial [Allocoleopsis sp.]
MTQINGQTLNRVDGKIKVTGNVKYTADLTFDNMVYGVLIDSAIAHGKITSIDTTKAKTIPGVLEIITYQNSPKVSQIPFFPAGQSLPVMDNENIYYSGQHIGIVVAETPEIAQLAADLIQINYQLEKPIITKETALKNTFEPETFMGVIPAKVSRGDIDLGKSSADIIIAETYTTPMTHHNPLETLACIAIWSGDNLTLYDTTQGVYSTKEAMAKIFNIPPENVRVVSEFLGGGFGCKAMVWDYKIIGAIAAKQVQRPVKLVLNRQQMYTSCGYRSETQQHITLGATKEGKLTLITHIGESLTSPFDDFPEPVTSTTKMLYDCPNLMTKYVLGRINAGTPTFARAPGEAPGMFALESAMDELAYALNLDPIELRLRNYAEVDPQTGHPWSSNSLRECYEKGAELFG